MNNAKRLLKEALSADGKAISRDDTEIIRKALGSKEFKKDNGQLVIRAIREGLLYRGIIAEIRDEKRLHPDLLDQLSEQALQEIIDDTASEFGQSPFAEIIRRLATGDKFLAKEFVHDLDRYSYEFFLRKKANTQYKLEDYMEDISVIQPPSISHLPTFFDRKSIRELLGVQVPNQDEFKPEIEAPITVTGNNNNKTETFQYLEQDNSDDGLSISIVPQDRYNLLKQYIEHRERVRKRKS